ncbi:hypothetical protein O181_124100 [Austropuccinia psidii MF-1]|uniref:Uncharacterized protein n=1 Tax=Austropuccinia psidii MF-1 TaxID=1389203 RepID=A0A9Q3KMD6_9BASI|nr:hypothetical protein [Austropuccinia psidii MF-1]
MKYPRYRVPVSFHQAKFHINCQQLTSCQANIKKDISQANVQHAPHSGPTPNPVTSTNMGSPVPSTDLPHCPTTIQRLVKITQELPVFTKTHQRGPPASFDVEKGCVTFPGHP